MNKNSGLLYCAPNILKTTADLKKLKIGIQTKGNDDYVGDNLILSLVILGKFKNSTGTQYKVNINGIIQSLLSK